LLASERINASTVTKKTRKTMLENIIVKAAGCSPFESEIIVNKTKEVCIGGYSETLSFNPGQVGLAAAYEG
jgi:hypothetical protein